MDDETSKRRVSRRSFLAGGATGAAASVATGAMAQEFINIGSLDDLPPNWWEIDLPPVDPGGPVDPPPPPPDPPVDDCNPIDPANGQGDDDGFEEPPGLLVRRNVFSLAPNGPELSALRRGIEVMRARPETDPTSYFYQARIHGIERGGAPAPFGAPWGTCRHVSNDFLTWHRLYLHFFERIVREASGDPNFALPYWDPSVPGQNTLPLAFRQQFANPLFEARRNARINAGQGINPIVADSAQAFRAVRFERPFFSASLENQPHNVIHVEIGGAMGDPATAGEDPIFWLHHANIDRLWSRWLATGGGRANPTDFATLNSPFPFADERGQIVTARGADALDPGAQLGYRYDDDPVAPAGADPAAALMVVASAQTPAPRPVPVARAATRAVNPGSFAAIAAPLFDPDDIGMDPPVASASPAFELAESTLAEGSGIRLGGRPASVALDPVGPPAPRPVVRAAPAPALLPEIDAEGRLVFPDPAPSIAAPVTRATGAETFRSDETAAQTVLLQLEDIDFDVPPGVWYAIYVNKPAAAPSDPRGPYFAGIFAPFAQNMSDEPTVFDITGLLNRQIAAGLFDGGRVGVEFVPNRDDPTVPPIDIGRVRIVRP